MPTAQGKWSVSMNMYPPPYGFVTVSINSWEIMAVKVSASVTPVAVHRPMGE